MINQRDICLVNLDPVRGHEQAGSRPALIIQSDVLNRKLPTTIIVPFTGNIKYKNNILHYFLEKEKTKLNNDSSLILFQIKCIDQNRIVKKIASLNKEDFKCIKRRLSNLFIESNIGNGTI
ncbi:MAG TPA: type II toxin-antitoxin system PemK/MazF family toxin [Candidatus Pacearchaeota archaeon]|nr:type II toxin-antitoxin system PemK/MazF family toxin [Candidatus Pacearchaeota archaeon]